MLEFKNIKSIVNQLMEGAIDFHVHTEVSPQLNRRWNILKLAEEANEAKMRALVLKCSHGIMGTTAGLAFLANKYIGKDIMIGSIVLGRPVGGLNPDAVKAAINYGSGIKVVYMPVLDSEATLKIIPRSHIPLRKALRIYKKSGELKPEAEEILGIIADNNLVLCCGHQSSQDILSLIEDAKNIGVKKIVVNHPLQIPITATLEQQKEMVKKGAILEHCLIACSPYYEVTFNHFVKFSQIVASIKTIGFKYCIIATDYGQEANPSPIEGLKSFIWYLIMSGIKPEEIEYMIKILPTKLLNLK